MLYPQLVCPWKCENSTDCVIPVINTRGRFGQLKAEVHVTIFWTSPSLHECQKQSLMQTLVCMKCSCCNQKMLPDYFSYSATSQWYGSAIDYIMVRPPYITVVNCSHFGISAENIELLSSLTIVCSSVFVNLTHV